MTAVLRLSALFTFSLLFVSLPLRAGELDNKMDKIVRNFTKEAGAVGFSSGTLAVFPFQADKKLEDRRINFTCSELLTNSFSKAKIFTMVERAKLDTIVGEQKLGVYGFVKSVNAAQLGKLLGARLAVVGSVFKLENVYHMSTELVDTETGQIIASDITEVPIPIFEDEASGYLKLVPEYETIGFYGAWIAGPLKVTNIPPTTISGNTVTPKNPSSMMSGFGLGIRYMPWRKWMFDFAVFPQIEVSYKGSDLTDSTTGIIVGDTIKNTQPVIRLYANRLIPLTRNFTTIIGAGAMYMKLKRTHDMWELGSSVDPEVQLLTPSVRLGLEYKIQERLRVSLFGNYNLTHENATIHTFIPVTVMDRRTVPAYEVSTPQLYGEITASFYF